MNPALRTRFAAVAASLITWAAAAVGLAVSQSAAATHLDGQMVTLLEPNNSRFGSYVGSTTVGPGIEFYGSYFTVDVSDTDMTISFFSGRSFIDLYPALNAFTLYAPGQTFASVQLVSSTVASFAEQAQSRIRTDAANLYLDFGGLSVSSRESVVVSFAPVPEPTSGLLLAAGLVAVAGVVRRRRRSA